ncbi:ChaN family lipoprotein [Proteus faecis]|nr:ChaN family lipoprotein [Proteus faecis]MDL5166578.1 ChaN family lipoprotein [Proteus faecis]MDL5274787.1 ChaN family lipoprotein [Proteus faecis]MDL5278132.1 ChaN family lipoprotein [Proteus faecis]MDL5310690.1 ChaN family lipoprotein [Proteus faecis]MDL5322722.1 ChaN family lipoprotein [Proteus faecis]
MIQSANIIDTRTGQSITADTLLTRLASQSRVIIGEKHDNAYHHDIEYWLMTELPKKRPQGAVLLEMLTPSQQSLVDNTKKRYSGSEYLRDERLMAALKWNSGWPWKWYGNIVKAGLSADYPLLAANIDRSEISSAYKNPPVIDGVHSTDISVRQLIQKTIELSHGGELDETQAEKMTAIQQLRDRAMAKSLLDAPTPALLIAGSFHATKVMGVPLHVTDLAPHENVTVVIMVEKGSDITSVHADYLWITPVALP